LSESRGPPLNVGELAEVLVVFVVTAFTLIDLSDVSHELDRSDPLDHFKPELALDPQSKDEGIRLGLNIPVPCDCPSGAPLGKVLHLFRFVPLKVKRRGVEMRLIINGGDEPRKPDPALLKAFARARGWFEELASGHVGSLVEIARREGLAKRYVTRLAKLAFISPAFIQAIAEGEASLETNLQMLMDGRIALPSNWSDQEQLFPD
jgi:hypothetical protein